MPKSYMAKQFRRLTIQGASLVNAHRGTWANVRHIFGSARRFPQALSVSLCTVSLCTVSLCTVLPLSARAQQTPPNATDQSAAQSPAAQSSAAQSPAANANPGENRSWIARDPLTGRLFQQEVINVSVPITQWEVKPVTTTVYEPKSVVKSVPSQQTTFTPTTQYVMQSKLRGWWNPLQQPVQAYEFVPVTTWQPQTQTVHNQVAAVEWVAKQQVVYVPQAVQKMQTQQQIVSRELPQPPTSGVYPPATQSMLAAQPRPLVTIPILAQQRMLPWPSANTPRGYAATETTTTMRNVVSSGLRPIASAVAPTYSAPLRTASSTATANTRDAFQTGMSPTILR